MTLLTILRVFPSLMLLAKVFVVNFLRPTLPSSSLADGKLVKALLILVVASFLLRLRVLEFLTNSLQRSARVNVPGCVIASSKLGRSDKLQQ